MPELRLNERLQLRSANYVTGWQGVPAHRRLIGAPSTVGRSLAGLAGVKRAVIFGSYARGTDKRDSDIDLMVIGNPDRDELTDRLERAGHEVGRPVNEVVMPSEELEARRARSDGFVASIDAGPVIEIVP